MKAPWKAALSAGGIVVLLGASLVWWMHKKESTDSKRLSDAAARTEANASRGDPKAEFDLALMYGDGVGVQRDYSEAARWYRKAAEQGYEKAQSNLADLYFRGEGVPKDYAEAVFWSQKAADQGDIKGEAGLGYLYFYGLGVKQDYTEAALWDQKAADAGEVAAQSALGYMYAHGQGVPQNRNEAIRWYRKAADQGDKDAQRALDWMEGRSSRPWWELVTAIIALPAGLLFSLESLFRRGKTRHWRHVATTMMGICFLLCAGLNIYAFLHGGMRYAPYHRSLEIARSLSITVAVLIIITAVLPAKKTSTER